MSTVWGRDHVSPVEHDCRRLPIHSSPHRCHQALIVGRSDDFDDHLSNLVTTPSTSWTAGQSLAARRPARQRRLDDDRGRWVEAAACRLSMPWTGVRGICPDPLLGRHLPISRAPVPTATTLSGPGVREAGGLRRVGAKRRIWQHQRGPRITRDKSSQSPASRLAGQQTVTRNSGRSGARTPCYCASNRHRTLIASHHRQRACCDRLQNLGGEQCGPHRRCVVAELGAHDLGR